VPTFGTTIGSGGFKFWDANHTVSYNYVQGVWGGPNQGPLQIDSGEVEGTSTSYDAHWRVVNALVERNVIVGCPEGIRIGDNYSLAPTGCTIRDNVIAAAASGTAVTTVRAPVSTTQSNNTYSSTAAGAGLAQDSDTVWRKALYGPRLSYVHAADVGITGDLLDTDGTGAAPAAGAQTVTTLGIPSVNTFGFPTITGGEPNQGPGSVPTVLGGTYCLLGTAQLGFTTVGTPPDPPPSSGQTVSGVGNIGSIVAFGSPVVDMADGPHTIAAVGIPTGERLGVPSLSGAAPPTPAPGGVLVPALYAVGSDGSTLTPLPNWSKISVDPVRNSAGAISVDYPAGADGFDTLAAGVSANPLHALEIKVWLGGNATGALGGWLVAKAGDDLTPGSNWTFSGHFHEWLTKTAIVGPQETSTANPNAELRFAGASAGLILGTLMDQAKARGALPLVTRDFTSTTDSNGAAWVNTISSFNLAPGTIIQQAVDKLVELGMVEYEITAARVWRAFNAGTRGRDTTLSSVPLTFQQATNLAQHSRRESAEDAATAVLAIGGEGFYEWANSATGQAELGWRFESGYSAGQISTEAGVQAAAETRLEIARHGVAEYDAAIEFTLGNPLPLIDYGIGDWAYVTAGNTRRKLRIAQLGVTFQPGRAPTGTVSLNDLIIDRLTALYRRLNALQTGDAVVGTSTATTGGEGEDLNPPAAPTGVVASSTQAYRVTAESTVLALVSVGWAAVTNNAYADTTTAGKAAAATAIAERMRSGQTVFADWSWNGMPTVVDIYNDALMADYVAAGSPTPAVTWLAAYPAAHLGGGAITDDVDHYTVQWSYLGGSVVGSTGSTPDWVIPRDPNDPTTLGVDYSWREPDGSPTSRLTITFGDVTAERAISIRVAAVDHDGNQGPWSAIVGVVTAADDTPPPAPSTPITSVWFETMDIFWDGKGSAGEDMRQAAPDLDGIEVHVAEGISFIPDRPMLGGKVNLAASQTYVATLYGAGTWNKTDLQIGVTYFARFVAVDTAGNASPPSATSAGVLGEQLVHIDIGPNAIAREQIIDGEIVNAKIANLAVNDAKISDLQVGKITAGTMVANVVLGGRFSTPISNGNHIEIDSAGIRLFQGASVVGRWQVFDASMMMTGQFNTAITGQRIVMNPGGSSPDTMRFYPTFSDVYSSIDAVSYGNGMIAGIRIVGSANPSTNQRGMILIRDQYASMIHGLQDLTYWGSEVWVEEHFCRAKSAAVDLIIDERLTSVAGPPRVAMICYDVNGNPINASGLYYKKSDYFGGEPHLYGNGMDVGIIFSPGVLKIMNNPNVDFRGILAASFTVSSSREVKRDIQDIDEDAVGHLRTRSPRRFRRNDDPDDRPLRLGFIAEDMPQVVRDTTIETPTDGSNPRVIEALDYSAITALLWVAAQRIDSRLTTLWNIAQQTDARLDAAQNAVQQLRDRVTALEQA